ncbi:MAG: xylosidase/arabinosidase, partial [Verrucomicrobiota bacterium]
DLAWCSKEGITYLPVLFPGFSWKNLKGADASGIPRREGRFLWQQFVATAAAGNRTAYLAMFDEIDEGTALFKCTNDPPIGESVFQSYEGLPSDHYLKLSGEGARLLRGELPVAEPGSN